MREYSRWGGLFLTCSGQTSLSSWVFDGRPAQLKGQHELFGYQRYVPRTRHFVHWTRTFHGSTCCHVSVIFAGPFLDQHCALFAPFYRSGNHPCYTRCLPDYLETVTSTSGSSQGQNRFRKVVLNQYVSPKRCYKRGHVLRNICKLDMLKSWMGVDFGKVLSWAKLHNANWQAKGEFLTLETRLAQSVYAYAWTAATQEHHRVGSSPG